VTTAVLGDSHGAHMLPAIGDALARRGEFAVHIGQSGCPPLMGVRRISDDGQNACDEVDGAMIESIGANRGIRRVIIAFRHTSYMHDNRIAQYRVPGTTSAAEAVVLGLDRTVTYLVERHKEVWLLLDVPELDFDINECVGRPFSFTRRSSRRQPCSVPRDRVVEQQRTFREAVGRLEANIPSFHVFDPLPYICDAVQCYAAREDQVFYTDEHHLSVEGAGLFTEQLKF
jgi:hypothetical protein